MSVIHDTCKPDGNIRDTAMFVALSVPVKDGQYRVLESLTGPLYDFLSATETIVYFGDDYEHKMVSNEFLSHATHIMVGEAQLNNFMATPASNNRQTDGFFLNSAIREEVEWTAFCHFCLLNGIKSPRKSQYK